MSAAEAAVEYVAAVNDGDADRLMALFAADAVLHHPTGQYAGVAKVREFYEELVLAGRAELQPSRVLVDERDRVAMFELTASSPLDDHQSEVRTLDVLDTDPSGSIVRLTVYYA